MATEKRLIDANALLMNEVKRCGSIPTIGSGYLNETSFKRILDDAPTVDAVEVVRCKDCKYRHDSCFAGKGKIYCDKIRVYFPLDGYCCYGERK